MRYSQNLDSKGFRGKILETKILEAEGEVSRAKAKTHVP